MKLSQTLASLAFGASALALAPAAHAQSADAADPSVVDEVVVTGRFLDTGAKSAMKMNMDVMDTPFAVSAYSESFLKATDTLQVNELFRYMTGVTRTGTTGADMAVRGFRSGAGDRSAQMVDGLPGQATRWSSPSTVSTDHIELVKGAASVLYGKAQPGGFVNIITKKPSANRSTLVEMIGTGLATDLAGGIGYDIALDTTGAFDSDERFLYRFTGQVTDHKGFRDNDFERSSFLLPQVTWNVTANTSATLQVEYRESHLNFDTYLLAPDNDVSRVARYTTSYQSPEDDTNDEGLAVTLLASHDFGGGWKWNLGYRRVRHHDVARYFDVVGFVPGSTSRVALRARLNDNRRNYDFADTNVTGAFSTGSIEHKAIVGVGLGREVSDFDRAQVYTIPTSGPGSYTLDLYNPSYANIPPRAALPLFNNTAAGRRAWSHPTTEDKPIGIYASDLMSLTDKLKLLVGLRYEKNEQSFHEQRAAGFPDRSKSESKWLPMAGLVFQPAEAVSLYTSYSTAFDPVGPNSVDVNGENNFKATNGRSVEAGVKANIWDGKANVTADVFAIRKTGVTSTFGVSQGCPAALVTCTRQIGAEESKGAELELDVQPIDNWQVTFGWAYTDAKVTASDDLVTVGARLDNIPKNQIHLWTRYDFPEGPLSRLGIGGGFNYTSARQGILPRAGATQLMPLPAYTVADLVVFYRLDRYDLSLKVQNVFDKHYIVSAGGASASVIPGVPRTITLALRMRFD